MGYELSGDALTELRNRSNLTRQAAATAIDVSITALQTAENGKTELRPSKLRELAALYGCAMEAFFVHVADGNQPVVDGPEVPEDAKSPRPLTAVRGGS